MPALAMANVSLHFYTVVMIVKKEEAKLIHSGSEIGMQTIDFTCLLQLTGKYKARLDR